MSHKTIDVEAEKRDSPISIYIKKNVLKKMKKRVLTPTHNGDIINFAHRQRWVTSLKMKFLVDKNSMKNNLKKDEKSC